MSPGRIVPMGQIVRGPVLVQVCGSALESITMALAPRRIVTTQLPSASMPPLMVAGP
jgi:hypothetical protein